MPIVCDTCNKICKVWNVNQLSGGVVCKKCCDFMEKKTIYDRLKIYISDINKFKQNLQFMQKDIEHNLKL